MRWFRTLRSRIFLLAAFSALPALLAVWLLADRSGSSDRAEAELAVATAVQAAAAEQRRLVEATRTLMVALADSTALALDYQEACDYLLSAFQREYLGMVGLRVLEGDGSLWCDGGQGGRGLPVLDTGLALAREYGEFIVSPPEYGPEGVAAVALVLPFQSRNQTTDVVRTRYLAAAIELRLFSYLHEFTDLITALEQPDDATLYLTDLKGRIQVRVPEAEHLQPGDISPLSAELAARLSARSEHEVGEVVMMDATGRDGIERLYAATAVRFDASPNTELLLVSGLPTEAIFAEARAIRRTGFAAIIVIVALAALIGMAFSRYVLKNDIRPLLDLTEQFARGRIPSGMDEYNGPEEFRTLRDAMIASARAQATSEDRLQMAMTRLDTYFRNSPLAFLELDSRYRIRLWTPAAEEMFGWPEAEAVGKTPAELGMIHPDDLDSVESMLDEVAQEAGYRINLNRNITRGGKTIWCEWHNSLVLGPDNKVDSVLCIAHDVTERQHAHETLEALNRTLEQRVAERTRELESFTYTVSHDLRGPLRAMDGFARLLEESASGRLTDEERAHLARVRSAAARMDALIEGLLVLARLSQDELRRREFDFSALCRATVEEALAREPEGRRVEVEVEPGMRMTADPRLMEVVVSNLASNALKFTRNRETARIVFGMVQSAEGTVYHVSDNGVGFDMEIAEKLFQPDDRFPSTGIGLATVSRVIRRHGGRVWAEGRPGDGAVFRFTIGDKGA